MAESASDRAGDFAARIRALAPEVVVHNAVFNGEGLGNDVVIVNDHLVFRFAKNDRSVAALADELQVLRAIRSFVPLAIPDPLYVSRDGIAYERVRGEPLSRYRLLELDSAARQAIADQLGDFLRGLHSALAEGSFPATRARARYTDWVEFRRRVERSIYPLCMGHQQAWLRSFFDNALGDPRRLDYDPRLIHGDLWAEHVLFDPASGRLSGIIDFGMAGLGDPATDLGHLLQIYGESFVRRIFSHYPEAVGLLPRARFYAETIELDWTLHGLASGDKYWFTAHLGGARDLFPVDDFGVKS